MDLPSSEPPNFGPPKLWAPKPWASLALSSQTFDLPSSELPNCGLQTLLSSRQPVIPDGDGEGVIVTVNPSSSPCSMPPPPSSQVPPPSSLIPASPNSPTQLLLHSLLLQPSHPCSNPFLTPKPLISLSKHPSNRYQYVMIGERKLLCHLDQKILRRHH